MTGSTTPLITVFTPAFNRAHTLSRLRDSLMRQGVQDFEWLVIDDGSSDTTPALLSGWDSESTSFEFKHVRVANGGKPRAITLACDLASGEYLFIVDSDDYLVDEAIEKLTRWIGETRTHPKCVGVGGIRALNDEWEVSHVEDPPYTDCTNLERRQFGFTGEMNEAYRVDVLKRYPFRVWEGETFVPEQVVFDQLGLDGWFLRWYREPICVGDYQADGLSVNADLLEARNPMGYAMLANHKLKYSHGRAAFRAAMQHVALSLVGGGSRYILETNRPVLTLVALPFGFLLSFRRRRQFRDRLHGEGNA